MILAPPQPPGSATWKVSVAPDGRSATFSVYVDEGGPVDLQLAIDEAVTTLGSGPAGSPTPTVGERRSTHVANAPASDRSVIRIGDHVGFVRDVDPDAEDVVMRLVPRVAGRLRLHVVDPEGWDVAGVQVEFRSMLDSYAGRTDAEGRAVLEDVPVLDGVATAEVPEQRTASLVRGKVRATPGEAEVTLPLRKGVRMRVRLPEGIGRPTHLSFARPGSTSRPRSAAPIALGSPDLACVRLRAHGRTRILPRARLRLVGRLTATAPAPPPMPAFLIVTTAEATVPVVDGAEVLLKPRSMSTTPWCSPPPPLIGTALRRSSPRPPLRIASLARTGPPAGTRSSRTTRPWLLLRRPPRVLPVPRGAGRPGDRVPADRPSLRGSLTVGRGRGPRPWTYAS